MHTIKKVLLNPQILSALIWAVTIVACGRMTENTSLSIILISAAGVHLIMMTQLVNSPNQKGDQ